MTEILFTCLKCESHYQVEHLPQPVVECPVCGWKELDSTSKAHIRIGDPTYFGEGEH